MEAATVTFSEAVPLPYWGMYTKPSQSFACCSDSPLPCPNSSGVRLEKGSHAPGRMIVAWPVAYLVAQHESCGTFEGMCVNGLRLGSDFYSQHSASCMQACSVPAFDAVIGQIEPAAAIPRSSFRHRQHSCRLGKKPYFMYSADPWLPKVLKYRDPTRQTCMCHDVSGEGKNAASALLKAEAHRQD